MSVPSDCSDCNNKEFCEHTDLYYCRVTMEPVNHAYNHLVNDDGECPKKQKRTNKTEDGLLEKLAELEHRQWMEWATTILKTESISQKRKDRWFTLFCPYSDLPEENKESDREWARKALAIIQA